MNWKMRERERGSERLVGTGEKEEEDDKESIPKTRSP
jgi:hypothetical protein